MKGKEIKRVLRRQWRDMRSRCSTLEAAATSAMNAAEPGSLEWRRARTMVDHWHRQKALAEEVLRAMARAEHASRFYIVGESDEQREHEGGGDGR